MGEYLNQGVRRQAGGAVRAGGRKRPGTGAALGRALVTGTLVTSLTLSPVLACPLTAYAEAQSDVAGVTSTVKKDETVYVKTDASGAIKGIYVVNLFNAGCDATVEDAGSYSKVLNLTDSQKLVQKDGSVKIKVGGDEPFYYQGTLGTDTELPWGINVTYLLDGKEVPADELAGASGELEIRLAVTSKADEDSDASDFANSCVLQAQGSFDESRFTLEDAGGATAAHVGNSTTVTAMVLPGESETFSIKGDARDFTYDGWQIAAMPLSMAIDISGAAGDLTDKADELSSATAELSGGAGSLADALSSIDSGASSLVSGTGSVAEGAVSLSGGARSLAVGAQQLSGGVASLAGALGGLSGESQGLRDGSAGVAAGATQLSDGLATCILTLQGSKQQLPMSIEEAQASYQAAIAGLVQSVATGTFSQAEVDAVNSAVAVLSQVSGAAGANQALDQATGGVQALACGASDLAAAAADLEGGAATYTGAVDAMAGAASAAVPGAQSLAAGATDLSSGADQLVDGTAQLASGTSQLSSGASQAKAGANTLSAGAQELAEATAGLGDEILDQVQEKIDEKLGAGYEVHSFVAPQNTDVGRVQFVYAVEGVAKPKAKKAEKVDKAEQTPIDRLLALFR